MEGDRYSIPSIQSGAQDTTRSDLPENKRNDTTLATFDRAHFLHSHRQIRRYRIATTRLQASESMCSLTRQSRGNLSSHALVISQHLSKPRMCEEKTAAVPWSIGGRSDLYVAALHGGCALVYVLVAYHSTFCHRIAVTCFPRRHARDAAPVPASAISPAEFAAAR